MRVLSTCEYQQHRMTLTRHRVAEWGALSATAEPVGKHHSGHGSDAGRAYLKRMMGDVPQTHRARRYSGPKVLSTAFFMPHAFRQQVGS